jgi:hypothetical protein
MVTATPDLSWGKKHYFKGANPSKMEAGEIFESILEKSLYEPDGTIKPHFRDFLRKQGSSPEEIAEFERQMKREIEERKLFAQGNPVVSSLRERVIARAGLDVEELLSQGYIAAEDLEFNDHPESFDWEDLL